MAKLWYTVNPDKNPVINFDAELFAEEVHELAVPGYEYDQIFDNYAIHQIQTLVVLGATPDRVAEVEKIYKIKPYDMRITDEDTIEYSFKFINALSLKRWHTIGSQLAKLYDWEYVLYSRWREQCKAYQLSWAVLQPTVISQVFSTQRLADTINEAEEYHVNLIPIESVAHKLKYDWIIDPLLNIAPWVGTVFQLIVNLLWSVDTAARYCNAELDRAFYIDKWDGAQFVIDWDLVSAPGVYKGTSGWYYRTWWSSWPDVKMTNFSISVHYKLIKQTGEIIFMVSLLNETGQKVSNVEWKNISSENTLQDSIMKYGNFHIYWGKTSVLKIHEMITSSRVPTIYSVAQYGFNTYKGNKVMVFPDWVWDMDIRKYYPKHETLPYYFIWWQDGIWVDGESEAWHVSIENVPRFNWVTGTTLEEYVSIAKKMYSDDTSYVMWLMACSMAWVAAYRHEWQVPSYFVTWVTWSGKSTFARFLAESFWVKNLYNIRQSTLHPIKVLLSAFKWLPAFFTEFRTEMKYWPDKLWLIQMCYDRSETAKWLRNGGMIKYRMESQVFCEWEDTYAEGSLRTRSILYEAKKSSRINWALPIDILHDYKWIINSFFANYLSGTCKQDYENHRKQWQKLFAKDWVEPRLSDNMWLMYAGAMAFAPESKDKILEVCNELIAEQMTDYNANGESQKIITFISQYLRNQWSRSYCQDGKIIIDWMDLITYKMKYRFPDMNLSMSSYLSHLMSQGWEHDHYLVDEPSDFGKTNKVLVSWVAILAHKAPKDLFVKHSIYEYYIQNKKA